MVEVRLERSARGISVAWARKVVSEVLRREGRKKSISVLLTGDRQIRGFNRRYLKHDYATDVIAFDYGESGDLVVSCQVARRVAKEIGISFKEEIARYLVHGALHLLGYKDKKKNDFYRMHNRQEQILMSLLSREDERWVTPPPRNADGPVPLPPAAKQQYGSVLLKQAEKQAEKRAGKGSPLPHRSPVR